jgi:hypothetical protein
VSCIIEESNSTILYFLPELPDSPFHIGLGGKVDIFQNLEISFTQSLGHGTGVIAGIEQWTGIIVRIADYQGNPLIG